MTDEIRKHPAPFSDTVLAAVEPWLKAEGDRVGSVDGSNRSLRIFDCFAGIGKVHFLHDEFGDQTWGGELEFEWASQHPRNVVANALAPPFQRGSFDVVFTSPSYGNRLADTYDGRDGSTRRTYRIFLGRLPSPDSGAVLQWGESYRELHSRVMAAVLPTLTDDGLVVINMSNHLKTLRQGDPQIEQHVVEWWIACLAGLGLRLLSVQPVDTPRYGFGQNGDARAESEFLLVFRNVSEAERAAARKVLAFPTQLSLL